MPNHAKSCRIIMQIIQKHAESCRIMQTRIRGEINNLDLNVKHLFYDKNDAMEKLKKAKDRNVDPVDMSVVGISTGICIR